MWFRGAHVVAMCGRDKDRTTRVSSSANEEPLVIVEARVNVMQEVIRKDCGNGCGGVVGKGETPLRRGGSGSVHERAFGAENGDVSCDWGDGGHQGSEILASRGGDENVVGVDGDVLVKRGEEEGVEDFLSYLGGSGRHR